MIDYFVNKPCVEFNNWKMPCCREEDEDSFDGKTPRIRGLTDGPCLLIFVTLWCILLVISVFSFTFGDPDRLAHGYDSFGNICGSNSNKKIGKLEFSGRDMRDKPYLFYFSSSDLSNSIKICVTECPSMNITNLSELRNYFDTTNHNLCFYDFDIRRKNRIDLEHGLNESFTLSSQFGPCPVFPIEATSVILNRCVPSNYPGTVHDLLTPREVNQLLFMDIYSNWHIIFAFVLSSFFGSFSLLTLFYLTTVFTSYLVIILSVVVPVVAVIILWYEYCSLHFSQHFDFECCQSETVLLASASVSTVLAIIILSTIFTMIFYLKKRIVYLNLLFKESMDCLRALPSIYAQPFITFTILCLFYIFWIFQMSYLMSARYPGSSKISTPIYSSFVLPKNDSNKNVSDAVNYFRMVEFGQGAWVEHMWWICIVCLVWISEFFLACQQMTIAGAVARWYFDGKVLTDKNPVWVSTRYLVLYHLGSAAFGSLLIFFFKIPRQITGFLYKRYRKGMTKNKCTDCVYKSCLPFFDFFENFMAFISHNAYTVIQMRGINFISSGKRAWIINTCDSLKTSRDNIAANTLTFLSKVAVTCFVGTLSFVYFNSSVVYSSILPSLLITVVTYFVAHCIFSVFELTIDTIYLCLSEDRDINEDDGLWRQCALVPQEILGSSQPTKPSTSSSPC